MGCACRPWRELIEENAQLSLIVDDESASALIDRWWAAYGKAELHVFGPCPVPMRSHLFPALQNDGGWEINWYEPHYRLVGDPPTSQFVSWHLTAVYNLHMTDDDEVEDDHIARGNSGIPVRPIGYSDNPRDKYDQIMARIDILEREILDLGYRNDQMVHVTHKRISCIYHELVQRGIILDDDNFKKVADEQ
jgi:hypothetical protein